ncbi:hypothetical protein CHS0354_038085, partial [Potamilus streckersoni]
MDKVELQLSNSAEILKYNLGAFLKMLDNVNYSSAKLGMTFCNKLGVCANTVLFKHSTERTLENH